MNMVLVLSVVFPGLLGICMFAGRRSESDPSLSYKEIVPGIYHVKGMRSNIYLVAGERLVVVDTGMKGDGEKVLGVLENIGRKPEDVSHILLTHAHIDHMGSLAYLKEKTGALVVASSAETDFVAGRKKTGSMGRQGIGGLIFRMMLYIMETVVYPYDSTTVDIACSGGEELSLNGPVHVVATPGHSMGSLSYYLPDRKVLFSGDALTGVPKPGLPQQMGCADYKKALVSVEKISELSFNLCGFGHGEPVLSEAGSKITNLIE